MKNNQQQTKVSCHYRDKQETLDYLTYHSSEDTPTLVNHVTRLAGAC